MAQRQFAPKHRALVAGSVFFTGAAVWLAYQATHVPPRPVYTPAGYGGYAQPPVSAVTPAPGKTLPPGASPVQPALEAYNAGKFQQAEAAAQQIVAGSRKPGAAISRREVARARWVLAFSAARRRDLATARERFAALKQAAAGERWTFEEPRKPQAAKAPPVLPVAQEAESASSTALFDRPVSPTGEALPTLEEEAAYQHAVLTAALARNAKPGTRNATLGTRNSEFGTPDPEAEFVQFMRQYPESPLVHASVRRIARMHGGNVPKDAEAVWKQAMATAQDQQHARDRERSLCGPEVLAEILGRASQPSADLRELAAELKTDHRGTTLAALAKTAEQRGLHPRGLKLTWDGLWKITNGPDGKRDAPDYLVALIRPGHYVLIEEVRAGEVAVWDPSAEGLNQPGKRRYSRPEWAKVWDGVTLRLDRK